MGAIAYVSDDEPGIRRRGRRRPTYVRERDGSLVRDPATLHRIRSIAVPPAWTDVWICAEADGHIQATGRDAKGRKQYRYHPRYRARREAEKFADLVPFGEGLPRLRRQLHADLGVRDLSRERVLALVIALLDASALRIGNGSYARDNGTFGLTTLHARHAAVSGSTIRFRFIGKGGKVHVTEVVDLRLARLVRRCQGLPGQLLFRWEGGDGRLHPVRSQDVNARLRELTGLDATAKTYRTWWASVDAARLLAGEEEPTSATDARRRVAAAVDEVADRLGNTRTVARASYVHPGVVRAYEEGRLAEWWKDGPARASRWVDADERRLLHVLRQARRSGLGTGRSRTSGD